MDRGGGNDFPIIYESGKEQKKNTIPIVVIDNMPYKTINVNPETYDRFVYYKHANMTFDDVLNEIMNKISEEDFYGHILEENREEIRKMKEGDHLKEDELDDFLDSDDE